jgi:hypothetical protein
MTKKNILLIDASINFTLGILLGLFPEYTIFFLGLPMVSSPFYASILGGVLFGIGIALLIERSAPTSYSDGLGIRGAIAINLCGGFVLAFWLLFGSLHVPTHGKYIMWSLVVILLFISTIELITYKK